MPKKIDPGTPIERPEIPRQPEIQEPVDPGEPTIPQEDPDIIPDEGPYIEPPSEVPPPADGPQQGITY